MELVIKITEKRLIWMVTLAMLFERIQNELRSLKALFARTRIETYTVIFLQRLKSLVEEISKIKIAYLLKRSRLLFIHFYNRKTFNISKRVLANGAILVCCWTLFSLSDRCTNDSKSNSDNVNYKINSIFIPQQQQQQQQHQEQHQQQQQQMCQSLW